MSGFETSCINMPRKADSKPLSTPSMKKSSSSGGQTSLLGFFSKTPSTSSPAPSAALPTASTPVPSKARSKLASTSSGSSLTPAPSSDAVEPEDEDIQVRKPRASLPSPKGLPSPVSADGDQTNGTEELTSRGTPSRRVSTHHASK